jgi:hypothetical protein
MLLSKRLARGVQWGRHGGVPARVHAPGFHLRGNPSWSTRGCLLKGDGVVEALGWARRRRVARWAGAGLEVVAAEVAEGLAGAEHVPDGSQDRVLDGADRAAGPTPPARPRLLHLPDDDSNNHERPSLARRRSAIVRSATGSPTPSVGAAFCRNLSQRLPQFRVPRRTRRFRPAPREVVLDRRSRRRRRRQQHPADACAGLGESAGRRRSPTAAVAP